MSEEIVFYTNPMSRGRVVRWMLEEVGQPYRTEIIEFGPQMKAKECLAINPMGKVPALVHRGTVITEVAAILAYLADTFPEAGLAPKPGSAERGTYYRWLFFVAGPLEAAIVDKSMGIVVQEKDRRRVGYGCYEDMVQTVEKAVEGGTFLADDRFSAADLYMCAVLTWAMMDGGIEKRSAMERYVKAMSARPALQRAAAIDDKLLSKKA